MIFRRKVAFKSRLEAGAHLGSLVDRSYRNRNDTVVIFVSQNAVPIAHEFARSIQASAMEMYLLRKAFVKGSPDVVLGTVGSGGINWLKEDVASRLGISPGMAKSILQWEEAHLKRLANYYRSGGPDMNLKQKAVLLVDDGFTPGATLLDANLAFRQLGASSVILAVPILAPGYADEFAEKFDGIVWAREEKKRDGDEDGWYGPFQEINQEQVRLYLSLWNENCRKAA
jgi:putative phosphoribosyl transferase